MDEGSVEASVGKNGDVNIGGELSGESKADNEIPSSSIRFDEENLLKSEIDAQDRKDQENERPLEMGSIDFKDHHSLKSSSSTLLFRQRLVQVYNQRNSQFILEAKENDETGQTEVTAKIGKDSSFGLMAMRVTYTLVAALMLGFLLIFCLQVLLFLFLQLTAHSGLTEDQGFVEWRYFLGTIFSVPLFVYSLACAMAIAAAFVGDAWNGHSFLNQVMHFQDEVVTQWAAFWVFIGIPLLVAVVALFAKSDDWWKITALVWYSCVFALYMVFAFFVVWYEVQGTMTMVKRHEDLPAVEDENLLSVIKHTILFRQIQRFSGVESLEYIIDDKLIQRRRSSLSEDGGYEAERKTRSLYTKFTELPFLRSWGIIIDEPRKRCRQYTIDEVRDQAPFVTSNTWSLEKLYCRSRSQRYVAVTKGEFQVTTAQTFSSLVCALIGNAFITLILASFVSWLDAGAGGVLLIILLTLAIMYGSIRQSLNLYKAYKNQKEREKKDDGSSDNKVIYQVWESFRINRISNNTAWTLFFIEVTGFFIWPAVTLFAVRNWAIAALFLIMGSISMVRHYFNCASVLRDIGDIGILDEDLGSVSSRRFAQVREVDFREKSRLNLIIGKISYGRRRNVWIWTFAVFVGIFVALFVAAFQVGTSPGSEGSPEGKLLKGTQFEYKPERMLPYPTCRMGKGLSIPENEDTALIDYTFLAQLAYYNSEDESVQKWLDEWFGDGYAKDEFEFVNAYRKEAQVSSAVHFKLISFPHTYGNDNFSIVAIRGTNNAWDALSDAQLWSAAALSQYLRAILPLGEIWTPIFENLINAVSWIEADSLEEVSYYKETVRFVEYLKSGAEEVQNFNDVRVTGHSLGGGLAFITGAQTKTPAIGLSGPNNRLSRKTFDPKISEDALDEYTFNIVPDRDPVPRIDDLSELYQRIHCTAPKNNPVDCHTASRSLCEILVKCGNNPSTSTRPIFCECSKVFGYPDPVALGDVSITDVCKS